MKSTGIIWVLLLVSIVAHAQSGDKKYDTLLKKTYRNTVPLTECEEAEALEHAIFLDTREREEYNVSHVPGARWVGYDTFNPFVINNLPKDTTIVVYCSIGYRSERIGERLQEMGYTNVRNLYGGIFQWANEERQLVNEENQETDAVHAYSMEWGIWLKKGKKVY